MSTASEFTLTGIIPMRVGTSYFFCIITAVKQDHPHACGDKSFVYTIDLLLVGSSPCVWGQVKELEHC